MQCGAICPGKQFGLPKCRCKFGRIKKRISFQDALTLPLWGLLVKRPRANTAKASLKDVWTSARRLSLPATSAHQICNVTHQMNKNPAPQADVCFPQMAKLMATVISLQTIPTTVNSVALTFSRRQ